MNFQNEMQVLTNYIRGVNLAKDNMIHLITKTILLAKIR